MLTSGEIAKYCKVSVRTIQFYDKIGLLKPSRVNKNGFRFYSEEDVFKLNCICLYKSLGFSLDEIKDIMYNNNSNLQKMLIDKRQELENEKIKLNKNLSKIIVAIETLEENGSLSSTTIKELNNIMKKKKEYKKTSLITQIFLIVLVLFTLFIMPVFIKMGNFYAFLILSLLILLSLGLVYYHSQVNAYICPKCGKKFNITFMKDLFSLNGGKKGKKLTCPYCKTKGWFKETYKN